MLESDRLFLREFGPDDFEAVHLYATDMEVVRYMEWGPNSTEETRAFLTRAQSQASVDPRTTYELAVVEISTGRLVGGIGLHSQGLQSMLGYCFARSVWGQGYASEAAQLVVGFAFKSLRAHRLWARCDAENSASLRVLEKLGMRREGRLRHECQIRGVWRDTVVCAILNEEWNSGIG